MIDFRKQILEDIEEYQIRYPNVSHIDKPEWAFNFWILDNLFSVEEELIEEYIVDYDDKGIDCFVWHEDLHDLYLIQNKYYGDNTKLTNDYVQNDFLTRALGALQKGTYYRSQELQNIYNKYCGEDDFCIHFHLYVTNNTAITPEIANGVASFNQANADKRIDAKLFGLDDIQELYYKEPITNKKSFKYTIRTINKGTELAINNDAYKLTLALDAKYVLTPIIIIYRMYKEAQKSQYSLFDDNIREYLGTSGTVNKRIVQTLRDPIDRSNFFFYNNGITMIVSDIGSASQQGNMRAFDVYDPQIVNGCQTVSTIYETLSSLPESSIDKDFENTFVMVKILKIPAKDDSLKALYRNIVTYNNSQNAINEKWFTASQSVFRHVQEVFEWKGFLLCIKQSDKHKYLTLYKTATQLLNKNKDLLTKFGIEEKDKTKDFIIEIEKLLQVILSFEATPQDAIQNKSKLLVEQSPQNVKVINFIKDNESTSNDLINLYMLYLRAEQEKNKSQDGRTPNPLYFIYCISKYECGNSATKISVVVKDSEAINNLVAKYSLVFKRYCKKWLSQHPNDGYNNMIKSTVDTVLLDECKADAEDLLSMQL